MQSSLNTKPTGLDRLRRIARPVMAAATSVMVAGMIVVLTVAFTTPIAFLWHNLIGAVVVVIVGLIVSRFSR